MNKRYFLSILLSLFLLSIIFYCDSDDKKPENTDEVKLNTKKLKSFKYEPRKRKLLIMPIVGKGNKRVFREVSTSMKNILDNHFKVESPGKSVKPTKNKEKALSYCAQEETDIVLIPSYVVLDQI